ncbi:MAG TPA: MoaD/ThiS family protein [Solirubrobacteraceae bacterium]|nr:MoaD/ThiS family protein [Solirubrobacteraceae bacterium]
MSIRVRLFAALREEAGTATTEVDASSVGEALALLAGRYGAGFARWLDVASVLVDGEPTSDPSTPLEPGSELVVLPPFSGG